MKFTEKELNDMLEAYQGFCCRGVEITSPIHLHGPAMCQELLRLHKQFKDLLDYLIQAQSDLGHDNKCGCYVCISITTIEGELHDIPGKIGQAGS